ncbi:VOC family protein, partial [Streptomyces sp. NPDC056222]|uniref:VOC family protein n=1 Tax=Streptomyces sp. NPDC056222 TaxID=3345749 RepID=UPI0035E1A2BF
MRAHVSEIVFDCADPAALVRFWAGLLGGGPGGRGPPGWVGEPPRFLRVAFPQVAEGQAR